MKKWLEPSIEKRVIEVSDICCANAEAIKLYSELLAIMEKLKLMIPIEGHDVINELESVFNANSVLRVEIAYRIGLEEGLKLVTSVNNYRVS